MHYFFGKADWMVRWLPCEPEPSIGERLRALRYFVNNLAPGSRDAWITISRRAKVIDSTIDDAARVAPDDPVPAPREPRPVAGVVLNSAKVLLGAIDTASRAERAIDAINPAPQTIRPDMSRRLAAALLKKNSYLLVTDEHGKYLGRYAG